MEKINVEARDRYYKELAIRLTGEGYSVGPTKDGLLPVRWLGEPLCRVTAGGGAQFREEELDRDGGREALDRAVDVAREVRQYMELMDAAPVLKASGLDENYKLLADFGGAVLAGHPTSHGVKFVTWEWTFDRTGVWAGHYFEDEYDTFERLSDLGYKYSGSQDSGSEGADDVDLSSASGTAREQAKKIMENYDNDAAKADGADPTEGAEDAPVEGKANEPKAEGGEPTQKSKSATYNTDKVDAEIKRLREQKQQFEKQLRSARDPRQAVMLQKQISRLDRELQQKDNDAYRREHAEKSE